MTSQDKARIRAMPSLHKGIRFKSRLEARMAGCLDDLGIRWVYEPLSVRLPSGEFYLPDFVIPEAGAIIEMKGNIDDPSMRLVEEFASNQALLRDYAKEVFGTSEVPDIVVVTKDKSLAWRRGKFTEDHMFVFFCTQCHRYVFSSEQCPHCTESTYLVPRMAPSGVDGILAFIGGAYSSHPCLALIENRKSVERLMKDDKLAPATKRSGLQIATTDDLWEGLMSHGATEKFVREVYKANASVFIGLSGETPSDAGPAVLIAGMLAAFHVPTAISVGCPGELDIDGPYGLGMFPFVYPANGPTGEMLYWWLVSVDRLVELDEDQQGRPWSGPLAQ